MNREDAEQLMAGIGKVSAQLSELAEACEEIGNDEVKKRVNERLMQTVDSVWFDVAAPICLKFPELDPDHVTRSRVHDRGDRGRAS